MRNQGLYESDKLLLLSKKASLDGFQKLAFTSGERATPASPIAPERESGVIFKNGTPVTIAPLLLPLVFVPPGPITCAKVREGNNTLTINKIYSARIYLSFSGQFLNESR